MSVSRQVRALESIAESLRRIADVTCAEHELVQQARELEAQGVHPLDCEHPPEYRDVIKAGAQVLRIGCKQCGAPDIQKHRRSA